MLPGPIGEVVDGAAVGGLPPALVGGAALGTLAAVCGPATLKITETWTVVPCLWIPLIGPTGAAKTPSITVARRKLRELDAGAYRRYAGEMEVWLGKPSAGRGAAPSDPTRLVNDITIEMVARWLGAGAGHGAVDADELTDWLRGLTRYRKDGATDAARWLSMWSGQPWRYQRVGQGRHIDILVERPVLTVCGGLQPHLLHLLGPEADGFRPRFLPHVSMTTDLTPGQGRDAPAWDAAIGKLFDATGPRTWRLEGPARELWRDVQRRWKTAQDGPEPPAVAAALAKADEQAARIALVLAESLDPAAGGPIPEQAMHAAVAITDYVMGVWRAMGPGNPVLRPPRHRAGSRRRCAGRLARAARRPVNRPGHPPQRRRRHPYRR